MPFDGGFVHKIAQELSAYAGARVDKISQPARELLVLALRHPLGNRKLLLSAVPTAPKVHFTDGALENPKAAPMFCMLLRKHLGGGKLLDVGQPGLDRVLRLVFEATNELGDRVELSLICEIMGRHSNIILTDAGDHIIDAVKRVDFVTSEVRQILPGLAYTPPPPQEKLSPLETPPDQLGESIRAGRDLPLSGAILEQVAGLSPVVCREISHFVTGGADTVVSRLSPAQWERLIFYLGVVATALEEGGGRPCLVRDDFGRPQEFTYFHPSQYPDSWPVEELESYSRLVDLFYAGRDAAQEIHNKSAQLKKHLVTLRDRLRRKLAAQGEELLRTGHRELLKQQGDIISANLYGMQKGDRLLRAENFFAPGSPQVEIPLDHMLTPAQNAQKYYADYRKAATAEGKLRELIAAGEVELVYLESVLSQLERAQTTDELEGIREELRSQGYLRDRGSAGDRRQGGQKPGSKKPLKLQPLRFRSSDGFTILCGRNNLQNDQLTLKEARGDDLWLHTQKIHGSHVIVLSGGEAIPNRTIEEAAVIAACYSAAGTGGGSVKVPVDYTPVRFVKKPRGGRPGMVIYETYQTAMVVADHQRAAALRYNPG